MGPLYIVTLVTLQNVKMACCLFPPGHFPISGGLLLIGLLGTYSSDILIEIQRFQARKCVSKCFLQDVSSSSCSSEEWLNNTVTPGKYTHGLQYLSTTSYKCYLSPLQSSLIPQSAVRASPDLTASFMKHAVVTYNRESIPGQDYDLMMTSSNGNIFRVTGHLCGEFTGHRWIPRTKASDAELWCFLWCAPE